MARSVRRRGARQPCRVPYEVLSDLEAGADSANHMEQIALDMGNLLSSQMPELRHRADEVRHTGLVGRMRAGGRILFEEVGLDGILAAQSWSSDTMRGWRPWRWGTRPV